jgi:hypothetical protein
MRMLQSTFRATTETPRCYFKVILITTKWSGNDPPEKRYERQRRENRQNSLRNTSTFIALCAKICHCLQIPYVVAPQEADFQAVKARPEKNPTVVTGDSDIIAYGSRKTIVMKKWSMTREEYRIISFVNVSTTQAESLPLYRAYLAFGLDVFAVWAACNGCDFSKGDTRIGVEHIGPAALIQVFTALMESNTDGLFDLHRVAESLIEAARTTPLVSPGELAWELQRIVEWYRNGGRFYDISNGNEYRGHEKKLICEANAFSNEHMRGKRDSGTKEPLFSSPARVTR